jgi:hypothetical protein
MLAVQPTLVIKFVIAKYRVLTVVRCLSVSIAINMCYLKVL